MPTVLAATDRDGLFALSGESRRHELQGQSVVGITSVVIGDPEERAGLVAQAGGVTTGSGRGVLRVEIETEGGVITLD